MARSIQVYGFTLAESELQLVLEESKAAGVDPERYFILGCEQAFREARLRHVKFEKEHHRLTIEKRHSDVDRNTDSMVEVMSLNVKKRKLGYHS